MFNFAVIGIGMIGSAALRYLSRNSSNVIGIYADMQSLEDFQNFFHTDGYRVPVKSSGQSLRLCYRA